MACRRVTVQEFENLPSGARGFSNPEECSCCSGECCKYQEFIGVPAETSDPGWATTIQGSTTIFTKTAPCDSPASTEFTWSEIGNPSNTQTYTASLEPGAACCTGICCEANESCCDGKCCDGSGPPGNQGCGCGECAECPKGYCRTSGTRDEGEGPMCDGNPGKINCKETLADGVYTFSYCDNV